MQTPELATEITLQPVEQVGVDAAIIFSDILVIPQAMGLEVQLIENKGPILPEPIQTSKDLQRINVPNVDETLGPFDLEGIVIQKVYSRCVSCGLTDMCLVLLMRFINSA